MITQVFRSKCGTGMGLLGRRALGIGCVASVVTASQVWEPAMAASAPRGLPPGVAEKMAQLDKDDQKTVMEEKIQTVKEWMSEQRFGNVLEGLREKPDVLDELYYIQVFYKNPLNASQRILLRDKVMRLIKREGNNLTEHQVDLLVYVLEYYGCV